jgi:hypothetical protein
LRQQPGGQDAVNLGYIKLMRSEEAMELLRRPKELVLLCQIALRAKRTTSFSTADLAPGEALIGDFGSCGLTEQEYRTAKRNLEKWGFITTRSTNRGTIAKLMNSTVFDINIQEGNDQPNDRATGDQRAANEQVTTNKNEIRSNKEKKERKHSEELDKDFQGNSFERFWKAYPRKKSKGQAEKAWKSISPDQVLVLRILSALEIAKTSGDWLRDGGRYIPYPATWLRAMGWEDEQQPVSLLHQRVSDVTRKNMESIFEWEPPSDER